MHACLKTHYEWNQDRNIETYATALPFPCPWAILNESTCKSSGECLNVCVAMFYKWGS